MSEKIYTTAHQRGYVSVSLSYPTGGARGRVATLRVTDSPSGQTLVEVDLSADDLMELMSNGVPNLTGARTPAYPERIGKRSQSTHTEIRGGSADVLDKVAEAQRLAYLADGWEAVQINRTNFGRLVVAHRWID
jgi:hypothetical protein